MVQVVQDSNPDMDVVASVDGWVITSTCSIGETRMSKNYGTSNLCSFEVEGFEGLGRLAFSRRKL